MCNVGGHYLRSTIVPGSLWALDPAKKSTKALTLVYKREFKNAYDGGLPTNELGKTGPLQRRTKKEAIDACNCVLTGASVEKNEPYKDVDIYTTTLWYHDKIKHTMYDLAIPDQIRA